jgi:hypothetical protein
MLNTGSVPAREGIGGKQVGFDTGAPTPPPTKMQGLFAEKPWNMPFAILSHPWYYSVVSTASVPRSLPGSEDLGNPRQGSSAPSGHAYARTSNWARHIAFLWIETLPE